MLENRVLSSKRHTFWIAAPETTSDLDRSAHPPDLPLGPFWGAPPRKGASAASPNALSLQVSPLGYPSGLALRPGRTCPPGGVE